MVAAFLSIENIAFTLGDYQLSYVELFGVLFGLVSVYLAAKAHIWTWPTGIVNEFFLFVLFYQIQLYADMLLQVYFFIVTLYGWYFWKSKKGKDQVHSYSKSTLIKLAIIILIGSLLLGYFFSNIHLYFPGLFPQAADYPFVDSLVLWVSVLATLLLAKKQIETWYLWILVDLVCIFLFTQKGVYFLALEYFIFLGIATYGLFQWLEKMKFNAKKLQ